MAVGLREIVFSNHNNIDVSLTIEAPEGHRVVTEHPVPAKSVYRVSPGVENCASVSLAVANTVHGVVTQRFEVAGAGQAVYLSRLSATHVVGSIQGTVVAGTEGASSKHGEWEADDFLRDVDVDETGRPLVLSRWGWRKVVFNGSNCLVAASRDEALAFLRAAGEEEPEALIDGCASRDPSNLNCYNTGGCKKRYCVTKSIDTGIRLCVCRD